MINTIEKRNLRKEMRKLSGVNFSKWFEALTIEEKVEYDFIIQNDKVRKKHKKTKVNGK